jgi:glycosyltransferase involved in cell wall biosynthesis
MSSVMLVTHSLSTGGTDRVCVLLANGFVKSRKVSIFNVLKADSVSRIDRLIDPQIETTGLYTKSRGRALDLILAFPKFVRAVRRTKPDVMMATGNNNAWFTGLGFVFNPNRASKLLVKVTNPIIRPRDGWRKQKIRRFGYGILFRHTNAILALSDQEAAEIAKIFPSVQHKIKTVQNPYVTIDMENVAADRKAAITPVKRKVIALGRLHSQKNLPLLIDAWARCNRGDAELWLVGEGPDRPKLEAQILALGLQDSVHLPGYQNDVTSFIRDAHCLALSSDYEGFPAVILEVMASGCPVVATDSFPAAKQLIGEAPGCIIVARRDSAALAQGIERLLAGPSFVAELPLRAQPYRITDAVLSHQSILDDLEV